MALYDIKNNINLNPNKHLTRNIYRYPQLNHRNIKKKTYYRYKT